MTSVIYFRMKSAASGQMEPVQFSGHQMSVAELKRAIIERKRLNASSLDFDLEITDADEPSKVYDAKSYVPKNARVVVRRKAIASASSTIVIPSKEAKQEESVVIAAASALVPPPSSTSATPTLAPVTTPSPAVPFAVNELPSLASLSTGTSSGESLDETKVTTEEEEEARALQAMSERLGNTSSSNIPQRPGFLGFGGAAGRGGMPGSASGRGGPGVRRAPMVPNVAPPPGYECRRCGKPGHFIQHCPTNSDPSFDKSRFSGAGAPEGSTPAAVPMAKVLGVPSLNIVAVKDLSGVDTTGKLVRTSKDGFEIVEPNADVYKKLMMQGGGGMSVSDIDLSTVDERLKCAYSQQLLRDAVRLPCCSKVVSDKAIREALFSTIDFRCPLCNQVGIVPDELRPEYSIRHEVEEFLMSSQKSEDHSTSLPPPLPQEDNVSAPVFSHPPPLPGPPIPVNYYPSAAAAPVALQTMEAAATVRPPPPPGAPPPVAWTAPPQMPPQLHQVQMSGVMPPNAMPLQPIPQNVLPGNALTFDFPVPMTKEEFKREQSIQLEARRKKREYDRMRQNFDEKRNLSDSRTDNYSARHTENALPRDYKRSRSKERSSRRSKSRSRPRETRREDYHPHRNSDRSKETDRKKNDSSRRSSSRTRDHSRSDASSRHRRSKSPRRGDSGDSKRNRAADAPDSRRERSRSRDSTRKRKHEGERHPSDDKGEDKKRRNDPGDIQEKGRRDDRDGGREASRARGGISNDSERAPKRNESDSSSGRRRGR